MFGMHRFAGDINQAYLIGQAEKDQQYAVRYPEGPIRDAHRDNKGNEQYALLIGNVYGVPTAGRVFAKERDRLILEHIPKETGWKAWQCTYDPCIYVIETDKGKTFISIHTDDCDGASVSKADPERIQKALDAAFSHEGQQGLKPISLEEVLGVRRETWTEGGIRYLKMHQGFKCQELYGKYQHERRTKPPVAAFPSGEGHPILDNDGRVTGVTEDEAEKVHKKGFREPLPADTPATSLLASSESRGSIGGEGRARVELHPWGGGEHILAVASQPPRGGLGRL
jgi:hypothetical protein